jgi:hypothetical protein
LILEKYGDEVRTRYAWLKIGTCGGLFWARKWPFGFHKKRISWLAEWLLVLKKDSAPCS